MRVQGEEKWGGSSGYILKNRYQPYRPLGFGRYVGLKRKKWNPSPSGRSLTSADVVSLNKKLAELRPFSSPQGAACYYGVPSRGIWQAIVSCLISQNLTLGESTKLGHLIYSKAISNAMQEGLSVEEAIATALSMAQKVGYEIKSQEELLRQVFETKGSGRATTERREIPNVSSFSVTKEKKEQKRLPVEPETRKISIVFPLSETREKKEQKRLPVKTLKGTKITMSDAAAANFRFFKVPWKQGTRIPQLEEIQYILIDFEDEIEQKDPTLTRLQQIFDMINNFVQQYGKGNLPEDFFKSYNFSNLQKAKERLNLYYLNSLKKLLGGPKIIT